MITHKEIPGGGGGECRTDGRYVSNMRDGSALVISNQARIECPPGSNVLYPRIPPVGEYKIVGQCSGDGCTATWEWRAGVGWIAHGESIGVSPCIYDYQGTLWRVTPGGPFNTSQGFRSVTWPSATFPGGQLVMGDDTMSAVPDGKLLHEYTLFAGGYYGGQGHDEGTHIVTPDGKRFVLAHGDNRFTRWTYDQNADVLAVAISDLSRQSVRFWWMTLADIRTLEPFDSTVPPIDPPIPPGGPMQGITTQQFDALVVLRRNYPETMTPIQTGDMLNRWAWQFKDAGLGMQVDQTDPHAFHPDSTPIWTGARGRDPDGRFYGQDVLIGASVGKCTPTMGAPAVEIKPSDPPFKAPVKPSDVVVPPDPPTGGDLEQRVARLEEQMIVVANRVNRHLAP